jgi:nucleoside phosphorylase
MLTFVIPTRYEAEDLLASLNDKIRKDIDSVECYRGKLKDSDVHVVICGMGPKLAKESVTKAFKVEAPHLVIMTGFAGALSTQLQRGDILVAATYSSNDLINYIRLVPGFDIARLHTTDQVVSTVAAKKKLAEETGCQMVDMEMSAVNSVALTYGSEVMGIRVISDLASEHVPTDILSKGYDKVTGKMTPIRMAFFLLFNPLRINELKTFLEPLPDIRKKLTTFLVTVAEEFE